MALYDNNLDLLFGKIRNGSATVQSELVPTLEAARAELATLRRDRERLEWLMAEGNSCELSTNTASPNHGSWFACVNGTIQSVFHDTPRAAIDCALEADHADPN